MTDKTIVIRNPKKGFYAYVYKPFTHIPNHKTISVRPLRRKLIPKFKAFYKDVKTKYSVHCDLNCELTNPLKVKQLKEGDLVYCTPTRRISKTKSSVALLYDPLKSTKSNLVPLNVPIV